MRFGDANPNEKIGVRWGNSTKRLVIKQRFVVRKGSSAQEILVYHGTMDNPIPFDPSLWEWTDGSPLYHFTLKKDGVSCALEILCRSLLKTNGDMKLGSLAP